MRSAEIVDVLYSWKCTFTFEVKSSVSWILIVWIQNVGPTSTHLLLIWKDVKESRTMGNVCDWNAEREPIMDIFSFFERLWEEIQDKIMILSWIILLACLISTHFLKDFKVSSIKCTCSLIYRFTLNVIGRGFQLFLEVRALNHVESICFIIRNEALSVLWRRIQYSMRRFECPRRLSKSWSFSVPKNMFRVCVCVCALILKLKFNNMCNR